MEDYTRVEVAGASSAAVIGAVVADVIHLLAELIENAASFSPPTTEVTVKVETVANGLAVEVVDRGIGLSREGRDELNRRLASAAEFDLADTERLGLFVVARLAAPTGGRAGPAAEHDDDFEEPSPELSRDLMSSLQSGWLRGRDAEADTATDDPRDEWGES